MSRRTVRQPDLIGLCSEKPGPVRVPGKARGRYGDRTGWQGVRLGPVPPACLALSPAELAAAIAGHARRVARGEPPKAVKGRPECWACGTVAPNRMPQRFGWVCRPVRTAPGLKPETECFCPTCFAEWGWPD
jgi:hypothetical protein